MSSFHHRSEEDLYVTNKNNGSTSCAREQTDKHDEGVKLKLTSLHSLHLGLLSDGLADIGLLFDGELVPLWQSAVRHFWVPRKNVNTQTNLIIGMAKQSRITWIEVCQFQW